MEKTETNQQLKLLLQIAKELIQEGKSNKLLSCLCHICRR